MAKAKSTKKTKSSKAAKEPKNQKIIPLTDSRSQDYLTVYSENCLTCKSLVTGARKRYKECHFENGNEECPALSVKIIIMGKVDQVAKKIRGARRELDAALEAQIWSSVASESPGFIHKLYARLEELL